MTTSTAALGMLLLLVSCRSGESADLFGSQGSSVSDMQRDADGAVQDARCAMADGAGSHLVDFSWRLERDDRIANSLDSAGAIRMRRKWPVGAPLAVGITVPSTISPAEVSMVPAHGQLRSVSAGRSLAGFAPGALVAERYLEMGRLELGIHHLSFWISVEREHIRSAWAEYIESKGRPVPEIYINPPELRWGAWASCTVDVVPTLDDVMEPLSNDRLGLVVRDGLSVAKRTDGEGRMVLFLDVELGALDPAIAFSLLFEVLDAGEVVQVEYHLFDPEDPLKAPRLAKQRMFCFRIAVHPDALLGTDAPGRYLLRVSGSSRDVLRVWSAQAYWAGVVQVPLVELYKP